MSVINDQRANTYISQVVRTNCLFANVIKGGQIIADASVFIINAKDIELNSSGSICLNASDLICLNASTIVISATSSLCLNSSHEICLNASTIILNATDTICLNASNEICLNASNITITGHIDFIPKIIETGYLLSNITYRSATSVLIKQSWSRVLDFVTVQCNGTMRLDMTNQELLDAGYIGPLSLWTTAVNLSSTKIRDILATTNKEDEMFGSYIQFDDIYTSLLSQFGPFGLYGDLINILIGGNPVDFNTSGFPSLRVPVPFSTVNTAKTKFNNLIGAPFTKLGLGTGAWDPTESSPATQLTIPNVTIPTSTLQPIANIITASVNGVVFATNSAVNGTVNAINFVGNQLESGINAVANTFNNGSININLPSPLPNINVPFPNILPTVNISNVPNINIPSIAPLSIPNLTIPIGIDIPIPALSADPPDSNDFKVDLSNDDTIVLVPIFPNLMDVIKSSLGQFPSSTTVPFVLLPNQTIIFSFSYSYFCNIDL